MKKIILILLALPFISIAQESDAFPAGRTSSPPDGDGPSATLDKAGSSTNGARATPAGLNASSSCPSCIKKLRLTGKNTNPDPNALSPAGGEPAAAKKSKTKE
jgi:hypothetical protein